MRLVDVLDEVTDHLERDEQFTCFHMDGQTVPIDDYLEIRPENAHRVRRLIEQGRLILGPWFVQPDLMLVGGEGLIRNLMLGYREAVRHGGQPMKLAYMCDMFGHPGIMPQILNGFGIGAALLGRGTNEHTHPAHFRWRGPDGSEVCVFKENDTEAYGSWNYHVRRPAGGDTPDEAKLVELARDFIEYEISRDPNVPHVLVMDGHDHCPVWKPASRALALLGRRLPRYRWVHDSLNDYAAAMQEWREAMPVFTGELRHTARKRGPFLFLISNTLSSRLPLKQSNDALLSLLGRWVEPMSLWANRQGAAIPDTYLPLAWRYLLLNHPHDSICGCSIDQVHRDMLYRFDQCRLIAEGVLARATRQLSGAVASPPQGPPAGMQVTVFNPQPQGQRRTIELELEMPPDWPSRFVEGFGYEQKNGFVISDAAGRAVPYQLISLRRGVAKKGDPHTIALTVDLPALGFMTLSVRPDVYTRVMGTLRTGPASAANEHVAFAIDPNGLLSLTHKATGQTFAGLLSLEDTGEIGDGWFHAEPVNNRTVVAGGPATVSCLEDGPIQVSFRIDRTLQLPARMNPATASRASDLVALRVSHTLTLRAGEPYLDVTTHVENNARNHRLRLLLPTGRKTDEYFVDEPFALLSRPVGLDCSTADWKEPDVAERSMWSIAGLADGHGGLAFVSGGGLKEVAALADEPRTLAVTLFRGYDRTVGTAGEPDGLLLGPLTIRYALAPFAGPPDPAGLMPPAPPARLRPVRDLSDRRRKRPGVFGALFAVRV